MVTDTMRAAQLTGPGAPLALASVPIPTPGPGELLVRLEACGVCHTDLHVRDATERAAGAPSPLILGHEGIGIVVAHGSGTTQIPTGTRVGVPWLHDTCDHCRPCLTGFESFCATQRAHGYSVNGGFAEYVVVQERFTPRIPDGLGAIEAAPLMCAGVTAYGAVLKAELAPGRTCVVIGCGGLGQYAVQLAKLTGAAVIAVDTSDIKLAQARALGADVTVRAGPDAGREIRRLGGADACLNFAPSAKIWPMITEAINPRGWVISVAMVSEPVPLGLDWLTYNGVRITGTSVGTRQELLDVLALATRHSLRVPCESISLEAVNDGLARLAAAAVEGRLVIDYRTT